MKQWSISAHNCIRRCQRQFLFKNLMAWHNAKDPDRREAYLLSQLRGLEEWQGHLVHLAIEKYFVPALQRGVLLSRGELMMETLALAREQWRFSERGDYKKDGVTKTDSDGKFLALREHEYGIPVGEAEFNAVIGKIEKCYDYLYSNEKLLSFLQSGNWHSTEPMLIFHVDGVPVVARLDLVVGYGNSKLCIIDWKIGESLTSDYSIQLRLYAYAALQKWPRYRAEDITLVEVNLLQGKIIKHKFDKDEVLKVEDFIYRSISEIKALTNGRSYEDQNLEDYGYARSPLSCQFCKFERLCVRLHYDKPYLESVSSGKFSWFEL
jgi:hypothetical protein